MCHGVGCFHHVSAHRVQRSDVCVLLYQAVLLTSPVTNRMPACDQSIDTISPSNVAVATADKHFKHVTDWDETVIAAQ